MLKLLKSTTAATLVASLVPAGSMAQDAPMCAADAPALPCVAPDGTLIERRRDLRAVLEGMGVENVGQVMSALGGGEDDAAAAEAEAAPPAEGETADAEGAAESEAAAEAEAGQAAAEEAAAAEAEQAATEEAAAAEAEQAAAEEAAAAEAEQAAAEEAAAAEAEQAAAEEAAAAEAEQAAAEEAAAAEAEQAAAEEAAAAEAGQAAAEEAAAAEAEQAAAEEAAAAEAEQAAAETEQAAAEEAAAAEAEQAAAEEAAAAEAQAGEEAEAETTAAADAPDCSLADPMVPCLRPNGSLIETRSDFRTFAQNQGAEDVTAVMDQLRANLGLPPRQEQQAGAAAAAEGGEAAEVETDEVTADEVRGAEEEFETAVTGEAAPSAEADSDDEGMSNFQRALLLGLGAAAVGSILSNGNEVVSNSGDRVVVDTDEGLRVLKNDDVLLRQPGSEVRTETFSDGSSRTFVTRENGSQVVTIRAADGTVLRRSVVLPDGTEVELFDDTEQVEPVEVASLPTVEREAAATLSTADQQAIRAALTSRLAADVQRDFSLRQIRQYKEVRALAPEVALDNITFATGSAAIDQSAADELVDLGVALEGILADDPSQVFLIEGHTDAVGDAGYNLALSDRRAETVALALTQFFDVPPENLITQGYGESDLLIETEADERLNRRASVRNISELLR